MKNKLEDFKINTKLRLSLLWVSLMFCYIYCDYFELKAPGVIEDMIKLQSPVGPLSPNLLATFTITTMVPTSMIFLSLLVRAVICKWLNIVVAPLWSLIAFMSLINLLGSKWYTFYIVYLLLEITLFAAIVWTAWKWPKSKTE